MSAAADTGATFDVAVIGLGPVGCLGAILFAEAGLTVVAIEKEPEVYALPRAVNLDGEIIRALQPAGLADAIHRLMQPLREGERAGFANSKRQWLFGGNSRSIGSNGWPPANMFDQPELEQHLRAQVLSHPNVTTYIGYQVNEFTSAQDQISLSAEGTDGDLMLAASYLVACDGANSPTRKALNIGLRDLGYDRDWLVIDVEMLKPHDLPNEVLQICDPDRIHTYVATKDPYRRWEFQLNPGESAELMLEHNTIHRLLETWTPRGSYKIRRAAVYQFHAAVADEWRHDRVFIAGDAAHQTPPFLGQGMNTGMRDVINLAWKLPLVLNDECAGNLLDTYQAERKDHAHDLVSWAVDMGHLMEHIAAAEAAERRGEKPPPAQQKSKKSGYGQGRELPPIRSGVVLSEQVSDDGATGYLLPQPIIRDPGGKQCRFDELLGPHFALLTMGPAVVNKASAAVLNALRVKAIDVSTLELVQGKFPELLTAGEALLLRPDRIVFGHTDDKTSIDMLCSKLASAIAVK